MRAGEVGEMVLGNRNENESKRSDGAGSTVVNWVASMCINIHGVVVRWTVSTSHSK